MDRKNNNKKIAKESDSIYSQNKHFKTFIAFQGTTISKKRKPTLDIFCLSNRITKIITNIRIIYEGEKNWIENALLFVDLEEIYPARYDTFNL